MKQRFGPAEVEAVYDVIEARRDMRHFRLDPVDPLLLRRLLKAAHQAPSVGYMQPWRFLRVTDANIRQSIYKLVDEERRQTARAEGLGMGWVSLFDPEALAELLRMPEGSRPVAILCLGHVDEYYDRPMLEQEGWAERRPLKELVFENHWPEAMTDDERAPRPAGGT